VFIGFLLWFRLVGIVILVAASWVAPPPGMPTCRSFRRSGDVGAGAARARAVRDAHIARADAPWWARGGPRARELAARGDAARDASRATRPPPRGLDGSGSAASAGSLVDGATQSPPRSPVNVNGIRAAVRKGMRRGWMPPTSTS
jgi:hypothetical protein